MGLTQCILFLSRWSSNSKTKPTSTKEKDGLFHSQIYFALIPNLLITMSISTEIGFMRKSTGEEILMSFVLWIHYLLPDENKLLLQIVWKKRKETC